MGLSRTTILTNFRLYINYINIKKTKKKLHHSRERCNSKFISII